MYNGQGDVIGLMMENGSIRARYEYDAWGNMKVLNGSGNDLPAESTGLIGNMNPFRYRGYYYDVETGFYYLQSRYYDPQTGRFINADSQLNIDKGIIGINQFTYCLNNPVNMVDRDGKVPEWIFYVSGLLSLLDGPLPVGETIALTLIIMAAVLSIGEISIPLYTPNINIFPLPDISLSASVGSKESNSNSSLKAKPITATKKRYYPISADTVIYRWGGSNPGNFAPRQKDVLTGLSFSTVPPLDGIKATRTTVGALWSTGRLVVIQDSPTHVGVFPAPHMGTMQDWIDGGSNHPCTRAVWSAVIKV